MPISINLQPQEPDGPIAPLGAIGSGSLPLGAFYVYKALGLNTTDAQAAFPPETFANELQLAGIRLRGEFPCIAPGGTLNLSGDDLALYEAALGYRAAYLLVGGDSATPGAGGPVMVERRLLDVVYKFRVENPADKAKGWLDLSYDYMEGVGCVRGSVVGFGGGGLLQCANPNTDEFGNLTTGERAVKPL